MFIGNMGQSSDGIIGDNPRQQLFATKNEIIVETILRFLGETTLCFGVTRQQQLFQFIAGGNNS
jgi:hypothetical protein